MGYAVSVDGRRVVVDIRNLKRKQGLGYADGGDAPRNSAPSEEPKNQGTEEPNRLRGSAAPPLASRELASPPWGPLPRLLGDLGLHPPPSDHERTAWLERLWPEIEAAADADAPTKGDTRQKRGGRIKRIALARWRTYLERPGPRAYERATTAEERAHMRAIEAKVAAEDAEREKNPPPPVPFKLRQTVM
ncbi:MAG: hypothetical protein WA001_03615 [Patescibacteria group bacterium]